jgi:hypothetical protein
VRYLSVIQGLYYVVTGIWPVLEIRTFQLVTGPKKDLWLVKAAGLLIGVIGGVLLLAGFRRRKEPEFPLLAVSSALSLAGIDIVYARRGTISRIYLLDAAGQLMLVAGWLATLIANRRGSTQ